MHIVYEAIRVALSVQQKPCHKDHVMSWANELCSPVPHLKSQVFDSEKTLHVWPKSNSVPNPLLWSVYRLLTDLQKSRLKSGKHIDGTSDWELVCCEISSIFPVNSWPSAEHLCCKIKHRSSCFLRSSSLSLLKKSTDKNQQLLPDLKKKRAKSSKKMIDVGCYV